VALGPRAIHLVHSQCFFCLFLLLYDVIGSACDWQHRRLVASLPASWTPLQPWHGRHLDDAACASVMGSCVVGALHLHLEQPTLGAEMLKVILRGSRCFTCNIWLLHDVIGSALLIGNKIKGLLVRKTNRRNCVRAGPHCNRGMAGIWTSVIDLALRSNLRARE
jgi:hypothetical protein